MEMVVHLVSFCIMSAEVEKVDLTQFVGLSQILDLFLPLFSFSLVGYDTLQLSPTYPKDVAHEDIN